MQAIWGLVDMSSVADIVELEEERSKRTPLTENRFDTAGAMLLAAREARNFSIENVGDAINVRTDYLMAIETMAIDRLPIAAYTSGFVKAYAQYLELPIEPMVKRFRQEAGYGVSHIAPQVAIPSTNELRGGRELSLGAVVMIVVFIIWFALQVTKTPRDISVADITATPLQERPIEEPVISDVAANELPILPGGAVSVPVENNAEAVANTSLSELAISEQTELAANGEVDAAVDDAAQSVSEEELLVDDPTLIDEGVGQTIAYVPKVKPIVSAAAEELFSAQTLQEQAAENFLDELPTADALDELLAADTGVNQAIAFESDPVSLTTASDDLNALGLEALEAVRQKEAAQSALALELAAPVVVPAPQEAIIVKALAVEKVAPVYPRRCERRADGAEAVVVTFDITSRGQVANPKVASSSNVCFNYAAISAITRWQFEPTTRDGAAVPTYGRSTQFNFQLPQ